MLHAGLSPPFGCQNVIYGGDTEGGGGHLGRVPPCHYVREGLLVNNLI